jgi:hypothetical protein
MTEQEFETIIKPLMLLDGKQCQFMRSALLENFKKWNETKQLTIHVVGNCAFLVQNKNTLLNHGLFSSEEKAKKYINGNTNYAIQKCDIA